jgi:hypothetical protein
VYDHNANYSGMYLNRKVTWRNHAEKTVVKRKEKLSVLNMIAGSK